jgi:uncharacterized protein YabE (DUF348 family)
VTFLTSLRRALPAFVPGSIPPAQPVSQPDTNPGSLHRTADVEPAATEPAPTERVARGGLRRPAVRIVVGAVALALIGGSIAVARAHKTVTLDVDGQVVQVSTFAGSVADLLEEEGITTGARDVVAPEVSASLDDGDDIVVRHAHEVTVLSDGVETSVWTTAVDATEALTALSARGDDVRLVASRSGGSRADLPIALGDGPVDVQVDGRTERTDGAATLQDLFAGLHLSLAMLDRVHVVHEADGRLTVVVQRVVVRDETAVSAIGFETSVEQTADLYVGTTKTVVAGVPGELAVHSRVTYVDDVEESRTELGQEVTIAPVTAVVREGTRERPARSTATVSIGGDVWSALARCESGGNPAAVSSSGKYYGLFQFSLGTWAAMGGSGLPSDASPEEQLQRAQALQAQSGWGQWPACARSLGLL